MGKDTAVIEGKWFKKLNRPTSGTFHLAHAIRHDPGDCSTPFHPAKVAERIKVSAKQHLVDHLAVMTK